MPIPEHPFRALAGAPLPILGEERVVLGWLDNAMDADAPAVDLEGTGESTVIPVIDKPLTEVPAPTVASPESKGPEVG